MILLVFLFDNGRKCLHALPTEDIAGTAGISSGLAATGGVWVVWSGDGSDAMWGQEAEINEAALYFSMVRMQTVSLSCEQLQ